MEEWRDIEDYKGFYQVSNMGRVRSLDRRVKNHSVYIEITGRIIAPKNNGVGYKKAYLYKKGKRKAVYIHRLVAFAFIKNPDNYKIINHKNSIRDDNRIENLEWCTTTMNIQHSFRSGRNPIGSKRSYAKLTEEKVLLIKEMMAYSAVYSTSPKTPIFSSRSLAKHFKVSRATISSIAHERSWKHVKYFSQE